MDAADPLRRWLENAALLEAKPDKYRGKPARLLMLRLDVKLNEEGRKAMKTSNAILKLWLGGDGMPIAADRDIQIRFSKFFVSYRARKHETREYQTIGGRLVVTRSSHDNDGSGLGHTEESHCITTVTLIPD